MVSRATIDNAGVRNTVYMQDVITFAHVGNKPSTEGDQFPGFVCTRDRGFPVVPPSADERTGQPDVPYEVVGLQNG